MYGFQPEEGTLIRTLSTVYADPDGTGLYPLSTDGTTFEKLAPGSVGEVESVRHTYGRTLVIVVRFKGGLRANLGPSAWELISLVDD